MALERPLRAAAARSGGLGYAAAVVAVGAATLVRLALDPTLRDNYPFATYFGAVAVVAWGGRTRPAVATLVLSGFVSLYLFLPPRYSLAPTEPGVLVGLALFLAVGAVMVAMGRAARAAHSRAERLLAEAAARQDELRLAVTASAEQRERLRTTLASIGDAVITTDTAGRVTNLNPVAESLTGWGNAEAAGQPLDAVFRIVNESTRLPVENPATRALKRGVIVGLANHTVLIARDGTERPIDDSAAPIRFASGEVVGCVLVFRDITARHEAERSLRESEDRAAFVRRAGGVGFWYCDLPFDVLQWDELVKAHFHLPPDATVTIDTFYARIHPDDREPTRRAIEQSIRDRTGYDTEYRTVSPDTGAVTWVRATGRTVYGADGNPTRFDGVTLDVTERKRAEERLRDSEERYRTVFESMDEGFCVIEFLDGPHGPLSDYVHVAANPAYAANAGIPDIVGQKVREMVPDEAGAWVETYRAVLLTGEPVRFQRELVATGRYLDLAAFRIGPPERRQVAVLFNDITARKRAEERLRASEERLRTALTAARMVAWEWTPADGKLRVSENAADVFGLPAGAGLTEIDRGLALLHPDDVPAYRATFQKAIDERGSYLTRYRMIRPNDGRTIWIEERGHAVSDQPGGAVRLHGVAADVTDRERAEEAVREARSRLESTLAAGEVGTWEFDVTNSTVRADPNLARMFGVTPGEAAGGRIEVYTAAIHPDDRERVSAIIGRAVQTGDGYEADYRLLGPDGSVRWVVARGRVERDGAGRAVRLPGVVVDVTGQRRAEADLRASEERYRTLFDTMDEGFCVIEVAFDPAGRPTDYRIEEMNAAFEKHTGMHGLVGRSVRQAIPALEEFWYETYGRVASTGEPARFVHRAGPMEGRWFEVYAFRLGGAGSNKVAILFNDVSAREAAEQAIRDSEAHFRSMADNAPTILWVTDATGRCTYLSSQWYEYTGRQPGADVGFGWLGAVHPDDVAAARVAFLGANERRAPFRTDYRLRRRDGEYRWAVDAGLPRLGGGGEFQGFVGCVLDVHERKRAEQLSLFVAGVSAALADLTDSVSTFQKIAVMTVPQFADWCAVDMVDEDGRPQRVAVMHADPEKVREFAALLAKYPPRAGDPHGILKVIRTGESELIEEITDAALASVTHDAHHFRRLKALGLRAHILVPIRSHGRTLGVVTFITAESGRRYTAADLVVAEDLASRAAVAVENARLYQALQESDRRKDEFLATLAHELRNPLAPIRNAVQMFRLKGADSPELQRGRDVIDRQVDHLARLIDDLLDISRIARNKLELRKGRVTLADAVAGAVETSRPLIEQMGHDLTVTLPPTPVYLDADLVRLSQVFMNLLTNAAKYTPEGGRIRLTAVREGGDVLVAVRDTGLGIPAEKLPNLFEMFFQVDGTLEKSQGGLGIGLSLVRRLAEMHGGTVAAHSDGPGSGSEFVVRLPVLEWQPDTPTVPEPTTDGPPREATARRVLVVDDNQDAADTLAMLLEMNGHEVRTAHDGEAGVEAAGAFRPDVVLMDIGMPKLNGYEACRRIREQPWGKGMLLIALTGWGQDDDRRRTDAAGFDAHLVKPVDHAALTKLLNDR